MSPEEARGTKLRWQQISISERFSSVLYPVDLWELLRRLPQLGWIVSERVLRGVQETEKPIASKGANLELLINQDNKTLGIRGTDVENPQTLLDTFMALREFVSKELDPSPAFATHYVEILGTGWARTASNPMEVLNRWWARNAGLKDLAQIVGSEVSYFGVRLALADADPNAPDWLDINIQPLTVSSDKRYYLNVVWRHSDLRLTQARLGKLNRIIADVIGRIERG